ncbi:TetR/AcrR family transcriptional regulator [Tumebacillus permanentifrigoris]|uniref:TetR family transcriptional regulator n=1 Tax=Tumebacillus permanentifrigoris TaxID=378543 RepID=A0A316DY25_9BACL|nr:TetR/AcrR family transcriptional regulator [Tumebacillus permanentifrigoris]PWK15021.1 TetR family transcriptional regulator [Tumebacillus permanentifrigoris]
MNKPSLRRIKREATAQGLAIAAFELALERGMDGFVVEDVVQRAGYSRRTFANYYSCKEEAVATAVESFQNVEEAVSLLNDLPDGSTPLDIMYLLMKMQLTAEYLRRMRKLILLAKQYPTLEPYILSILRRMQTAAEETLRNLSQGKYPEGYTHLLVGAVFGAMSPLLDGSINVLLPGQSEDETAKAMTFDQYLDNTFHYLRNGF